MEEKRIRHRKRKKIFGKMEQDKDGFFYEKENFTNLGENSGKKEKAGI